MGFNDTCWHFAIYTDSVYIKVTLLIQQKETTHQNKTAEGIAFLAQASQPGTEANILLAEIVQQAVMQA